MATFEELGVRARTATSLQRHKITTPNPVQRDALPELLRRRDVVIEAPTGSGKTLAFAIPLVERLAGPSGGPRALIVTPTRELASQVASVINVVDPALRVVLVVGGVGYGRQISGLRGRPDVVVGCPGRILDLCEQNILKLGRVEYLVLDEADEMLDQGFAKDVERIIDLCPTGIGRQTVLASATMPDWVQRLISKHLNDPARVRIVDECVPTLEHGMLSLLRANKIETLTTLLARQRTTELPQTIVFHRTKHGAKKLARDLNIKGHSAVELQGNLSQNARDKAIAEFRAGKANVMVATNVAARGIDVVNVGLVVNYELPDTPQWLTHRIGRTARNGNAGRAITFFSEEDGAQWRKLRRLGAPELPHVESSALLTAGKWNLLPQSPTLAIQRGGPGAPHLSGQSRRRPYNNYGRPRNAVRSSNSRRPA